MPNFARTVSPLAIASIIAPTDALASKAKKAAKTPEQQRKEIVQAARRLLIKERNAARQVWLDSVIALKNPRARIHNTDALAFLKMLPDESLDAIITDPPYGINMAVWDPTVPGIDIWREAFRALKPGAYIVVAAAGRTYHQTAGALAAAGFEIRDMLIWHYTQSFPGAQAIDGPWRSNLKNNQEPWVVARKPLEKGLTARQNWAIHGVGAVRTGKTGEPGWQTNVISCPKPKAKERNLGLTPGKPYNLPGAQASGAWKNSKTARNTHPTQKPIGLMRRLVRTFSPDGGVIADPFCGTGSTLIAGVAEGRVVFGSEREHGYWDVTCDRIAWAEAHPHLVPRAV